MVYLASYLRIYSEQYVINKNKNVPAYVKESLSVDFGAIFEKVLIRTRQKTGSIFQRLQPICSVPMNAGFINDVAGFRSAIS